MDQNPPSAEPRTPRAERCERCEVNPADGTGGKLCTGCEAAAVGEWNPEGAIDSVVEELCAALEIPVTALDGHSERRITLREALDRVRGRTVWWRVLLTRAEEVDADWLTARRTELITAAGLCSKPGDAGADWQCTRPAGHDGPCSPWSTDILTEAELRCGEVHGPTELRCEQQTGHDPATYPHQAAGINWTTNRPSALDTAAADKPAPTPAAGQHGLLLFEGRRATTCRVSVGHRPRPLRFVWHHILPLVCGGETTAANLVELCDNCHYAVHALLWNRANGLPVPRNVEATQLALATKGYQLAVQAGTVVKIPHESAN